MKLNTHDRTPRIKNNNKFVIFMFCVCAFLFCLIFSTVAFCCIYYAKNVFAGVLVLLIPVLLTVWIVLSIKDLEKAYIEIKGNDIYVVDYYYGIKKEKHFLFQILLRQKFCLVVLLRLRVSVYNNARI